MADFSNEDIQRAAERVREMYARSTIGGQNHKMPPSPDFVSIRNFETAQNEQTKEIFNKGKQAKNGILNLLNFKNLEMNSDITLILGILLLLTGESDDDLLIMALVYIMM